MPGDDSRVYLYGFLPISFGRYVVQSVLEGIVMVALLVAWFWGWPALNHRLSQLELPTSMVVIRFILAYLPGFLLILGLYKAIEWTIMLRAFKRKAVLHSSSGTNSNGQTTRSPLSGTGPGREESHP
jgi:hypothetical protein